MMFETRTDLSLPRLAAWLGVIIITVSMIAAPAALADDESVSTGKRILGVSLGSVNGALAARALTIHHERTPTIALIYAGAVGGGAAIGYAVAGNDDALVAMGILLIPLAVLNIVLPSSSYPFETAEWQPAGSDGAMTRGGVGGASTNETATADWWKSALWRAVPQPAVDGMRLAPVRLRF